MSNAAVYIVTASGGTVLEKTASNTLQNRNGEAHNKAQQWTVEYADNDDTKVSFQNVSDGKFLRATSGAAYGKLEGSDEKQWFTLSEGGPNGSVWYVLISDLSRDLVASRRPG